MEHALDVEGHDGSQAASSNSVSGDTPGGARVVDQDVQASSRVGDRLGQPPALGLGRQVGGRAAALPDSDSSAATSSQTSALRDEMYTFAPASTKPRAIIRPMPRDPPVTTAFLPAMEKRSLMSAASPPASSPPLHSGSYAAGSVHEEKALWTTHSWSSSGSSYSSSSVGSDRCRHQAHLGVGGRRSEQDPVDRPVRGRLDLHRPGRPGRRHHLPGVDPAQGAGRGARGAATPGCRSGSQVLDGGSLLPRTGGPAAPRGVAVVAAVGGSITSSISKWAATFRPFLRMAATICSNRACRARRRP